MSNKKYDGLEIIHFKKTPQTKIEKQTTQLKDDSTEQSNSVSGVVFIQPLQLMIKKLDRIFLEVMVTESMCVPVNAEISAQGGREALFHF